MASSIIFTILLRGATIGLLLVMGVGYAYRGKGRGVNVERIAAMFMAGTIAYVLVSAPVISLALDPYFEVFVLFSTLNSVFFWWFATALFEADFKWRWWRFIPLVLLVGLFVLRNTAPYLLAGKVDNVLHELLVVGFMLHAIWLALAHRAEDLLENRRRFRVVFAAVIGLTGLIIAVVELILGENAAPNWLDNFQAISIFILTLGFAIWILHPKTIFDMAKKLGAEERSQAVAPEHKLEFERLQSIMDTGVYTQENFNICALADKMNIPEYRLRRLINGQLGFRNFSTFLNSYRLADARTILADPNQARRQIAQIAYELGYGSLAPFNRAFKNAEGVTPTTYRRLCQKDG